MLACNNYFGFYLDSYIQAYCWAILAHGALYFFLFANFYIKAYTSKKKTENLKEE